MMTAVRIFLESLRSRIAAQKSWNTLVIPRHEIEFLLDHYEGLPALNAFARSQKDAFRLPGCRLVKKAGIASRAA